MYNIPDQVGIIFFNSNYIVTHSIFAHMYHYTKPHSITCNIYPQTLYEYL
jgi:hypothetical protein